MWRFFYFFNCEEFLIKWNIYHQKAQWQLAAVVRSNFIWPQSQLQLSIELVVTFRRLSDGWKHTVNRWSVCNRAAGPCSVRSSWCSLISVWLCSEVSQCNTERRGSNLCCKLLGDTTLTVCHLSGIGVEESKPLWRVNIQADLSVLALSLPR